MRGQGLANAGGIQESRRVIDPQLPRDLSEKTGARSALILGRSNGVGLDRDAALLRAALESAGVEVKVPRVKSPRDLLSGKTRADVAFHLERVSPLWRWKAGRHLLIPNQERYPERLLGRLKRVDRILCKSRHAEEIFSKHHGAVRFVGFTSEDRDLAEVAADYGRFFHLAGKSTLKNTEILLKLWERHPEWPVLTLVQHPQNAPERVPGNVDLVSRYLPDEELRVLQNVHGVHLCPSLSEGWGHYIVEGMSCAAVVVTTDGPPMNELVEPDRGVVVAVDRQEPRHLGTNFHVNERQLEEEIGRLVAAPDEEKAGLGRAARKWFEKNQVAFSGRIAEVVEELWTR